MALAVGSAIDDPGHESLTAQALVRTRAALGTLVDGQGGSFAVGHSAGQCSGAAAARRILASAMARGDDSSIPKGRIRRTAQVGSVVGTEGARYAGTRAANIARSKEGAVKELRRLTRFSR